MTKLFALLIDLLRRLFNRKTKGGLITELAAANIGEKLRPLLQMNPMKKRPVISAMYKFRLNYLRAHGIFPNMRNIKGYHPRFQSERNADRKGRQFQQQYYRALCLVKHALEVTQFRKTAMRSKRERAIKAA